MNETIFKYITLIFLYLYILGMCIYSAITAHNNIPNSDSSNLFIISYVMCIINSIVYIGTFFNILIFSIYYKSKQLEDEDKLKKYSSIYIPLILNIYWMVINFNYKISKNYDEFALVKTIEFFVILGFLFINILCAVSFLLIFTKQTGFFKTKSTVNNKNSKNNNKSITNI